MSRFLRLALTLIVSAAIGYSLYGGSPLDLLSPSGGQTTASQSHSDTAAKTDGCESPSHPITVSLPEDKYPNIVAHIRSSWREGYPKVLTINREGADVRRDKLLAPIPTRDGYDRDEAPAASLRDQVDASVEYVPSSENRSAGSSLGSQIAPYCDGVKVRYSFN